MHPHPGHRGLELTPATVQTRPGSPPTELSVRVHNTGPTVERFLIELEGLDPTWYTITRTTVSLLPGDDIAVPIRIFLPPGRNQVAGKFPFQLRVLLDDHSLFAEADGLVEVQGEAKISYSLSPQRITGRRGKYRISITNAGSQEAELNLSGQDAESALSFDFTEDNLRIPPYGNATVPVTVRPRRSRFVGMQSVHPFTIAANQPDADTSSPLAQASLARGDLIYTTYLRNWRGVFMLLLLIALVILALIFGPQIYKIITSNPTITAFTIDHPSVNKGETITLRWEVQNAVSASISEHPEYKIALDPQGRGSLEVTPTNDEVYTLCATGALGATKCSVVPLSVHVVTSQASIILFTVDHTSINKGESVTLRWEVTNTLKAKIAEDERTVTFDSKGVGSIKDSPTGDRNYTLCVTGESPVTVCSPVPLSVRVIGGEVPTVGTGGGNTGGGNTGGGNTGGGNTGGGNTGGGNTGGGNTGGGKPTPTLARQQPTARPGAPTATRVPVPPTQVVQPTAQVPVATATQPVVVPPTQVAANCDTTGDKNGHAEPVLGHLNDTIKLVATGFKPGEPILLSLLTPDFQVRGGEAPIDGAVAPDGSLDIDPITVTQDLLQTQGRWTVNILGASSNNRSSIHFCIAP